MYKKITAAKIKCKGKYNSERNPSVMVGYPLRIKTRGKGIVVAWPGSPGAPLGIIRR
jgi:hypothetical protein